MSPLMLLRILAIAVLLAAGAAASGAHAAQDPVDCTPGLGASAPPAMCTAGDPCTALLSAYAPRTTLSIPMFDDFTCNKFIQDIAPGGTGGFVSANDGPLQTVAVPGTMSPLAASRRYCQYIPPAASAANKVPLVIMVHGSGGNATVMYAGSGWRAYGMRRGFAVVGTQAMNRHWPASGAIGPGEDGTKNDYLFRNVSHNDDIRYFDALVDQLVATGKIDPSRIYLSGWSNGAYFVHLYTMLRSGSTDGGRLGAGLPGATPAGNKVAAAATFSGGDPLLAVEWNPQCRSDPPPVSAAPILIVSRLCDVVACAWVSRWVDKLRDAIGSRNATWLFVDGGDNVISPSQCSDASRAANCTPAADQAGHGQWPMGNMVAMIDFMMSYTSAETTTTTVATTAMTSTAVTTVAGTTTTSAATAATTSTSATSASPAVTTTTTESVAAPPSSTTSVTATSATSGSASSVATAMTTATTTTTAVMTTATTAATTMMIATAGSTTATTTASTTTSNASRAANGTVLVIYNAAEGEGTSAGARAGVIIGVGIVAVVLVLVGLRLIRNRSRAATTKLTAESSGVQSYIEADTELMQSLFSDPVDARGI